MEVHQGTPGATRRVAPERGDPMPSQARARMTALQGASNDARDAAASASVRLNSLQSQLDGPELSPAQAASINHEIARLQEVRNSQNARHSVLLTIVDNLRRFVQSLPNGTLLEVVKHVPTKRDKSESISDAISRTRDLLNAKKRHRHTIGTAALPKSALKAAAQKHVEEMARRGTPRVTGDANGVKIVFDDGKSFVPRGVKGTAELLAWFDAPSFFSKIEALIDAMPPPAVAMEVSERERRLAELAAEILQLERDEEALVLDAAKDGFDVLRRPDAAALAVLGCQFKTRAPRVRAT